MKQRQNQRQTVNIVISERVGGRRKRTRRVMKRKTVDIRPNVPVVPFRGNLETGYNLYMKLAQDQRDTLDKRGRMLDERSADLERLTRIRDTAEDIRRDNERIRKRNLDTIAEDLNLRFRAPPVSVLTTPAFYGSGGSPLGGGFVGGVSPPPVLPPSPPPLSPTPPPVLPPSPTFAPAPMPSTSPAPPSFADVLAGVAGRDSLLGGSAVPPTPAPVVAGSPEATPLASATVAPPQAQTASLTAGLQSPDGPNISRIIGQISSKVILIEVLRLYGEVAPDTASVRSLRDLLRDAVSNDGDNLERLRRNVEIAKGGSKAFGGGGGKASAGGGKSKKK